MNICRFVLWVWLSMKCLNGVVVVGSVCLVVSVLFMYGFILLV